MPVKAVLFDLDQTLTDRRKAFLRAGALFNERFAADHGARDNDRIADLMVQHDGGGYTPRSEFCASLERDLAWPGAAEFIARFWDEGYPECAVEVDGATATLQDLRARGYRLGIITNGLAGAQNRKVDYLGFRDKVDCVVVSGDVGIHKPDPAIFQMALDGLEVDACDAVYVGDHPRNDVVGARAAGIRPIWIRGHFDWPAEHAVPEHAISGLDELEPLLVSLGQDRGG